MRLIDADALAKFPIRIGHYDKVNGNEHFVFGIESVLEYAEYLPTIDAVPVVRCKDCKHYEIHRPKVLENCERNGHLIPMSPDDFCSYGERRSDE